jgi:hypothetical protein
MPDPRIYQYAVLHDLDLSVSSFVDAEQSVELENVVSPTGEYGGKRFDLIDASPRWNLLNFEVGFRVPDGDIADIIPHGDSLDSITPKVIVSCSATKYRIGYPLTRADDGSWSAEIQLARSDLRGVVSLTPILVRTRELESSEGYATYVGAILGTGPDVELILDKTAPIPLGEFDYKYEVFALSNASEVAKRPDDVFFVDPRNRPRIHLNIRWPSLQTVLESKGRTGVDAALRNAYAAAIGQDTWTQLLVTAVGSIRAEDDEYHVVGSDWRSDLVARLGQQLYPDEDSEQRLKLLFERFTSPEDIGLLVAEIASFAQQLARTPKRLDDAANAAEESRGDR